MGQAARALVKVVVFLIKCLYSAVWLRSAAFITPKVLDALDTHTRLMVLCVVSSPGLGTCTVFGGSSVFLSKNAWPS